MIIRVRAVRKRTSSLHLQWGSLEDSGQEKERKKRTRQGQGVAGAFSDQKWTDDGVCLSHLRLSQEFYFIINGKRDHNAVLLHAVQPRRVHATRFCHVQQTTSCFDILPPGFHSFCPSCAMTLSLAHSEIPAPHPIVLTHWPAVNLSATSPLTVEGSFSDKDETLIYRQKDKDFEGNLILYPFSTIVLLYIQYSINSIKYKQKNSINIGIMTDSATNFGPFTSSRNEFHLVPWPLNPTRK